MGELLLAAGGGAAQTWAYAGFVTLVAALIALDLGVLHRRVHTPGMFESIAWTALWIAVALLFGVGVIILYEHHVFGLGLNVPVVGSPNETVTLNGWEAGKLYLTAYVVEKSLSIDNVFVIAMIFSSFAIPVAYQHGVLFWGILGALLLRGAMIALGSSVVVQWAWINYVFGALLMMSAVKLYLGSEEPVDLKHHWLIRLLRRCVPVTDTFDGPRLFTRREGTWIATPLVLALALIEATDLLFAVDSIPAVFGITGDPFLIFSSNIMAILGLRALYFCLASAVLQFKYLKPALIGVLLFVGIKLCLAHTSWHIATEVALAVILALLMSGIVASILWSRREIVERAVPDADGIVPAPSSDSLDRIRDVPVLEQPPRQWAWLVHLWRTNRTVRRVCVLCAGSIVILVGVIISPLPGPGLTILGPLGLGILASEFLWARRIVTHARRHERGLRGWIDGVLVRISRLWIIPVVLFFWGSAWLLSASTLEHRWIVWSLTIPVFTPLAYVLYRWWHAREKHE